MFFIAYPLKGQVHVFAGLVELLSYLSCSTSAMLKYFCPLIRFIIIKEDPCLQKHCHFQALKALMAFEKFTSEKVEEEVADILIELRRLLRMLDRPYLEKLLIEVNKDTYKHAR